MQRSHPAAMQQQQQQKVQHKAEQIPLVMIPHVQMHSQSRSGGLHTGSPDTLKDGLLIGFLGESTDTTQFMQAFCHVQLCNVN